MAQNITLLGASYTDVPAVELPKTGGGTATFTDTTPTTASASDVSQGKYFFTASGVLTLGTNQGGSGSVTQDQDGYIVLPSTGGGGGSTGLEYETGTFEPTSNVYAQIYFSNTHTTRPSLIIFADVSGTAQTNQRLLSWIYGNWYDAFGQGVEGGNNVTMYGRLQYGYGGTAFGGSGNNLSALTGNTSSSVDYYVTTTYFKPNAMQCEAGRTYKWLAVWKPTT